MFKPSKLHHCSCTISSEKSVPNTFDVLCWNVHKNNTKNIDFKTYLEKVEKSCDFFVLQEAAFRDDKHFTLPHLTFDAAANLEFKKSFYGVLTASRIQSYNAQAYLSIGKESFIGSHKSILVTHYIFEDNTPLLILNIHAINFRENKHFHLELERLFKLIEKYQGAMIIAGDFNTWNKRRIKKLHDFRENLGLQMIPYKQSDSVKSFMRNQLDFIFYRGIQLVDYSVDSKHKLSDHNPLYAKFKKNEN